MRGSGSDDGSSCEVVCENGTCTVVCTEGENISSGSSGGGSGGCGSGTIAASGGAVASSMVPGGGSASAPTSPSQAAAGVAGAAAAATVTGGRRRHTTPSCALGGGLYRHLTSTAARLAELRMELQLARQVQQAQQAQQAPTAVGTVAAAAAPVPPPASPQLAPSAQGAPWEQEQQRGLLPLQLLPAQAQGRDSGSSGGSSSSGVPGPTHGQAQGGDSGSGSSSSSGMLGPTHGQGLSLERLEAMLATCLQLHESTVLAASDQLAREVGEDGGGGGGRGLDQGAAAEVSLADDGSAGVGATAAAAVSVALAQSWAAAAGARPSSAAAAADRCMRHGKAPFRLVAAVPRSYRCWLGWGGVGRGGVRPSGSWRRCPAAAGAGWGGVGMGGVACALPARGSGAPQLQGCWLGWGGSCGMIRWVGSCLQGVSPLWDILTSPVLHGCICFPSG